MAESKLKRQRNNRDGGQFLAMPIQVLDSPAYRAAGHTARSLLLDIARQCNGRNNGGLVACAKYLAPLGWRSNDTVTRALRELVQFGLLVETRKGARPNKAAWFALTWRALDVTVGLDIDPKRFRRGSYLEMSAGIGKSVAPSAGVAALRIVPSDGVGTALSIPSGGAIRHARSPPSTPSGGAYLELPSVPVLEVADAAGTQRGCAN